jgi:hypothetical protein
VTRNLDGSGANAWPAGTAYLVLGNTGDGRIELNAYATPRIQILLQGSTYNSQTEIARLGDLAGSYGIGSELYGVGIGDYSAGNYLRYDGTNGFMLHAGDDAVTITDSGIRILAPASGTPQIPNSIDFTYGADSVASLVGYYSAVGDASGLNLVAQLPSANDTSGSTGISLTADAQTGVSSNTSAAVSLTAKARQTTTGNQVSSFLTTFAIADGTAPIRLYTMEGDGGYANMYFRKEGLDLSRSGSLIPYIKIAGNYLVGTDGWAPAGVTWTYVGPTSFTAPGDVRAQYPIGTKIKLTQTTPKYFYVVSTSYTSPNTVITVTGGSDYSLVNAVIVSPYLSYVETPQGFPGWFNWAPTLTGFSVVPGSSVYQFKINGQQVFFNISQGTDGTSNATMFTISLPVTARTGTSWQGANGYAVNNSVGLTAASKWFIPSGGTAIQLFTNMATGTWTASGGKRALFQGFYQIP